MTYLAEPLPELFSCSQRLILQLELIPADTPRQENIAEYFKLLEAAGENPRLPEHRQAFNDTVLQRRGKRYLVSAYGEDRAAMLQGSAIAKEGRTIHLGIDIFAQNLEPVLAPCSGTVVRTGREAETHSFGNYVILRPDDIALPLLFLGHLSFALPTHGTVQAGQPIAALGDYRRNENGGWSRHLHLQCLRDLPPIGSVPLGYGSVRDMPKLRQQYPDPTKLFGDWQVQ